MDLFNVKNKNILITGASRGIGKAFAVRFKEAGANVFATGSREESIAWMKNEGITGLWGDLSSSDVPQKLIQEVYSQIDNLHVLINNAGTSANAKAVSLSEKDMDRIIDVNFKSVFRISKLYYKEQSKRKQSGNIINISSVLGLIGSNQVSVYGATKGAVNQLTKNLALEWARSGFRVNSICPGYIETDMISHLKKRESFLEAVKNAIPMKRIGKPEDLIGAALYLASEASSFMTGQCMVIDGGLSIP